MKAPKHIPGQALFILTGHPEPVRPGKVYQFQGRPYSVGLRNECRVRLDPLWKQRREIVSRLHDIRRVIFATPRSVNVSASTALCPILDI